MSEPLAGLYDDPRTLTIEGSFNREVSIKLGNQEPFFTWVEDLVTAAREAAQEANVAPVDREALARAAHHYFCIRRSEPNHDPRRSDYDKADEILEILALIPGGAS